MSAAFNPYAGYIDLETEKGIKLYANATETFSSHLKGKVKLEPVDADKLTKEITDLANRFGYRYIIENIPTVRTVVAADPEVKDSVETIVYSNKIKLLENFSDENITFAQKQASLIWGDQSFTSNDPMTIRELSVAEGELTNTGRLTNEGKNIMRDRLHSKFAARHCWQLLDEEGQAAIELEKDKYTWTSEDGRQQETCGIIMLAIVCARICPHFKADMFDELAKAKAITLKDHNNDLHQYFDAMRKAKQKIDRKDKDFYSDNAYLKDLFSQLKMAPVETFAKKYETMELEWIVDKTTITPTTLIREATVLYNQLNNNDGWKGKLNASDQVVLLTSKVTALASELHTIKSNTSNPNHNASNPTSTTNNNGNRAFKTWRLTKVENGKEHCAIFKDGKWWWFCEDGHKYNDEVVGMYCTHKPGAGHIEWRKKVDAWKEKRRAKRQRDNGGTQEDGDRKTPPEPANDDAAKAKKLALNQSLQAALTTTCGITPTEWNDVWASCCSETGN